MTTAPTDPTTQNTARVWRFEVTPKPGQADPIADRAEVRAAIGGQVIGHSIVGLTGVESAGIWG
ncbi:MAG: hypothetical protein ACPGYV_08835, partial [Phycisphaeraceae bacterium]